MDRSHLAHFEHANMIEAMALVASMADGAQVRRDGGIAVISSGLPFILFNQVIVERDEATSATLSEAVAYLRDRSSPFVVNLRVGADDRFTTSAGELGLVPISEHPWMPGMALHPLPTDPVPELPSDHEIREVTDVSGLEDHIRTGAIGFDMAEGLLRAVMVPDLAKRDGVSVYVGYTGGEPVSTGLGFRTGRTIGVYNIATIPSARGRGYGAAMTRRVVADGAASGCDVAILQASEMGYPIYERLGYRTVVKYAGHVERPDGG